jgi:hypothetical protein
VPDRLIRRPVSGRCREIYRPRILSAATAHGEYSPHPPSARAPHANFPLRTPRALLALSAARASAQASPPRNEISVGAGILTAELAYARRLGSSPVSVGAGVWGAWEPPTTFGRDVLEPLGATVFARLRRARGPRRRRPHRRRYLRTTTARSARARSRACAPLRWWAIAGSSSAPRVAVGTARDERNGSDFGAIWGVQARLVLGWGR